MRHLAWLNAAPEGSKKSRLASYKEVDENSQFLNMPELSGADYIITLLFEAGLMSSSGMGPLPLSWQEIESWLTTTERQLCLWERVIVKELSEVYVNEYIQASDKNRPAPYLHVDVTQIDRAAVVDKLKNALSAFKKKPSKESKHT